LKTAEKALVIQASDAEKSAIQAKADIDHVTAQTTQAQKHAVDLKDLLIKFSEKKMRE
jgi:hypothetical protein